MTPGDIVIRPAVRTDLAGILRIENACFGCDAFSRRQFRYLLSQARGIFRLALREDVPVAYMSMLTTARHPVGRIYSLAVVPECRGMKLAGRLMDEAIAYARSQGLEAVFLEVRTDNRPALSLYEKKGFVRHAVKKNYYPDGADAYSMVIRLL